MARWTNRPTDRPTDEIYNGKKIMKNASTRESKRERDPEGGMFVHFTHRTDLRLRESMFPLQEL